MQSYGMTFGFREPYQVLGESLNLVSDLSVAMSNAHNSVVDAGMIQDISRFKMDLLGGLERALHGKIKPSMYTWVVPF